LREKAGRGGGWDLCAFAGVFEGGFGKSGVQWVVFCGEVVVNCVVNVDGGMRVFG
jgi:hypothetical protein